MQQRSIVTFQDPDNNRTIMVNFEYDTEAHTIEYNVKCEPEMVEGEDYGFNLFLANYLMKGLQAEGTEKPEPKKRAPRKKKIKDESNTESSN